jgi:hypothetical protein
LYLSEKLCKQTLSDVGVASWIRSIAASRLASNAKDWAEIQASHNSGTYNCQWMIIDFNKFQPNEKKLKADTFWVLETIPGMTHMQDMTRHLEDNSKCLGIAVL